MKTFDEVLKDIEINLVGLKLPSIRPGAEITIVKLDRMDESIHLTTSKGQPKKRPFKELEKLWRALCDNPAIHVDSVLKGSGSSRNQPETILANLPYVEWFKHSGKKHLAIQSTNSHKFGTLKEKG